MDRLLIRLVKAADKLGVRPQVDDRCFVRVIWVVICVVIGCLVKSMHVVL